MKRINSFILSTIAATILVGCGGGSSSSSINTTTGTLIDNTVSGIKYVNGSATGYTDVNGNFPYTEGLVEFYLGGIKLGEMSAMTSDNKVFIQDIIGLERTNTTDTKLLKIASLLQSLDSDTSTDEIEIDSDDFSKFEDITDNLDSIDVSTVLGNNGFIVKSEEEVKAHLENSLKEYGEISDTTSPELLSSSIVNGQTGVSKSTSIVLTFSEDIPKEYLTNQYFSFMKNSDSSEIDLLISSEGSNAFFGEEGSPIDINDTIIFNNVVILDFGIDLEYSESYTLIIDSDLKDFAGNTLSNDGGNTDILIEFLVENEVDTTAPVITSNSTVNVDENQTDAFTIMATDNSSTLTYGISGIDADSFNINNTTGVVTFKTAPDYETKDSYSIMINVTDGSNNSSSKNITVDINDVFEADTTYPIFTSSNTISVDENQTAVLTVSATDNSEITYSLTGTDASSFNIDSTTGVITFKTAPNYENKTSYSIIANATDSSSNTTTQNITVSINDVYENTPPIANAGVDKEIYFTESVTLDASNSSDNSAIVSYEWKEGTTVLSDQSSFVKSDFTVGTHHITLSVTDDEDQSSTDRVTITAFDDFTNILPMDEVGGIKSVSSSTIGTTTTTTLAAGSQLYFEIENDMNRDFTVNSFNITSYYNGNSTLRTSSSDSSILSGGTLTPNETISLGYTLNSSQTANYWVGTYSLTDVNTGETFTNSFTWNGTVY